MEMATTTSSVDLNVLGVAVAQALYMSASFMLVASGVQLFMCLNALSVFLEAPIETRRTRRPYLIVSFITFVLFSFSTALDAFYIQNIQFEAKSGADIITALSSSETRFQWARRTSSLAMLGFVIASDGILVYRCHILSRHKLWVCLPPVVVYFASVVLGVVTFAGDQRNFPALSSAWTFTAVLVNILATSIIAFRLVQANKILGASLIPNGTGGAAFNVFIDSAIPPTVFGIFYGISMILHQKWVMSDTNGAIALYVLRITSSLLYFASVAISPQLIMFRISTGTSPLTITPSSPPRSFIPLATSRTWGSSTSIQATLKYDVNMGTNTVA